MTLLETTKEVTVLAISDDRNTYSIGDSVPLHRNTMVRYIVKAIQVHFNRAELLLKRDDTTSPAQDIDQNLHPVWVNLEILRPVHVVKVF